MSRSQGPLCAWPRHKHCGKRNVSQAAFCNFLNFVASLLFPSHIDASFACDLFVSTLAIFLGSHGPSPLFHSTFSRIAFFLTRAPETRNMLIAMCQPDKATIGVLEPARSIVTMIGGPNSAALIAGVTPETVWRWCAPKENGGSDGFIPRKRLVKIKEWAKMNGVNLPQSHLTL